MKPARRSGLLALQPCSNHEATVLINPFPSCNFLHKGYSWSDDSLHDHRYKLFPALGCVYRWVTGSSMVFSLRSPHPAPDKSWELLQIPGSLSGWPKSSFGSPHNGWESPNELSGQPHHFSVFEDSGSCGVGTTAPYQRRESGTEYESRAAPTPLHLGLLLFHQGDSEALLKTSKSICLKRPCPPRPTSRTWWAPAAGTFPAPHPQDSGHVSARLSLLLVCEQV